MFLFLENVKLINHSQNLTTRVLFAESERKKIISPAAPFERGENVIVFARQSQTSFS